MTDANKQEMGFTAEFEEVEGFSARFEEKDENFTAEFQEVQQIAYTYEGETTDDIVLTVDNQNRTISAEFADGAKIDIAETALSLSLTDMEEIVPFRLSIEKQNDLKIFLDDDGVTKYASLGNLGYTRIKVVNQEDLSLVNINDFLFIKKEE